MGWHPINKSGRKYDRELWESEKNECDVCIRFETFLTIYTALPERIELLPTAAYFRNSYNKGFRIGFTTLRDFRNYRKLYFLNKENKETAKKEQTKTAFFDSVAELYGTSEKQEEKENNETQLRIKCSYFFRGNTEVIKCSACEGLYVHIPKLEYSEINQQLNYCPLCGRKAV